MRTDEEKAQVYILTRCTCRIMTVLIHLQIEKLNDQMLKLIPLENHGERCLRRDSHLAALAKLKQELQKKKD